MGDRAIFTMMITLGNVAVAQLANIGTKLATTKLIKDKKAKTAVDTVVPIVTSLGIGAYSSTIVADVWNGKYDNGGDTDNTDSSDSTEQAAIV